MQAVVIAGLAAVELLRAEQGAEELACVSACAGLDAGEVTALVYAGVLDFEDALRVVQVSHSGMLASALMMALGLHLLFNSD